MPRPNPDDLTIAEIVKALGITHMTLDIWRRGTSERHPLPCHKVPCVKRHHVYIREKYLTLWLSTYRPELLPRWEAYKATAGNDNAKTTRRRKQG